MNNVSVHDLIKVMKGNLIIGDPRLLVKRISINTRTLERGDFFLALQGKRFNGHDFLPVTLEKGASGLIISQLKQEFGKNPLNYRQFPTIVMVDDTLKALQDLARMYRQRFVPQVIGITGTNGKTTTKEMLGYILSQHDNCLYSPGNYNNHIGLPLTLLQLEPEHTYVVVEMGASAPGDIAILSRIARPHIGLITNIAAAHLESFGSVENILRTKMELIDSLPEDGDAVINSDDPLLKEAIPRIPCRVTTFGLNPACDISASSVVYHPNASYNMIIGGERYPIELSYAGKFNVYNALAASAVAWRLGIDPGIIAKCMSNSTLPPMHNEVSVMHNKCIIVQDAYNANPTSMRSSIESFVLGYPEKIKHVVLGDMLELGDRSEDEHRALGAFLALLPIDSLLILGEYRQLVCDSARQAGMDPEKIRSYDNRAYVIEDLARVSNSSTVIFFKASRAMAFEQLVAMLYKHTGE